MLLRGGKAIPFTWRRMHSDKKDLIKLQSETGPVYLSHFNVIEPTELAEVFQAAFAGNMKGDSKKRADDIRGRLVENINLAMAYEKEFDSILYHLKHRNKRDAKDDDNGLFIAKNFSTHWGNNITYNIQPMRDGLQGSNKAYVLYRSVGTERSTNDKEVRNLTSLPSALDKN